MLSCCTQYDSSRTRHCIAAAVRSGPLSVYSLNHNIWGSNDYHWSRDDDDNNSCSHNYNKSNNNDWPDNDDCFDNNSLNDIGHIDDDRTDDLSCRAVWS